MKTATEIYNSHLEAFRGGLICIDTVSPKFKDKASIKAYLIEGGILPVLFNKSIEASQSIYNQFAIYSGLSFTKDSEAKFKKVFIGALNQLGIN